MIEAIDMLVHCWDAVKVNSIQTAEREELIGGSNEYAMAADSFSALAQDGSVAFS